MQGALITILLFLLYVTDGKIFLCSLTHFDLEENTKQCNFLSNALVKEEAFLSHMWIAVNIVLLLLIF